MPAARKIINDPVYGFITIDEPLILELIAHPWYQRLRNIHQMAFAHLVYPGAVHSRLHHSLGAYHLMCMALTELKRKGVEITGEEERGAKIAILLHDIGHGPYSHALEQELLPHFHHEQISIAIMEALNREFNGALDTALRIFRQSHPKKFLSQLVSGQLDVDRMDYLNRDSFFTGVAEGVIGYDRIIKMLTVKDGELMVEEKAIYSIEKFLVSRRLMYWQVYLHKTVLSAEMMLVKTLHRVKELIAAGEKLQSVSGELDYFLYQGNKAKMPGDLGTFCSIDDHDLMATIKKWNKHPDPVLSLLSRFLVERKLLKARLQSGPFDENLLEEKRRMAVRNLGISEKDSAYFAFTGEATNTTYDPRDERIQILFRDGSVKDISQVDNALIHRHLSAAIKKHYICYLP